jgi:DNA-binding CsgD family transcriptional regulator
LESARRAWELGRGVGGASEFWAALRYADVLAWRGEVERATELWLRAAEVSPVDDLRGRCAVGEALFSAGEDERALRVLEAVVELVRTSSSLGLLPYALQFVAMVETRRGRLETAAAAATEAEELATALGQTGEQLMALGALTWIEALLGRDAQCRALLRDDRLRGRFKAQGMLELSLGRFDESVRYFEAHAREDGSRVHADAIAPRSFLPNLIEAYVRSRRVKEARSTLEIYEAPAARSGRASALALALRCRALIDDAADDFAAALREHDRWDNSFERARTQLAYGEFLRRTNRRVDARAPLRRAIDIAQRGGATATVRRAHAELIATGARPRRLRMTGVDSLTAAERRVAKMAADGMANRDIAQALFVTVRTVEVHLSHAYRKLDIESRKELPSALGREEETPVRA